jgi:ClpP class serine protease
MKRLLKSIFSLKGLVAVLFVLFIVVPIMQSWRIEKLRDDAISALEKKRGSRVIVLIHRQESVNVLGVPLVRYINIEDSEAILRAIRFTDKNTPIDFILHTPGGLVLAASQIAKAIKRHPAKTTVFVPHYAMSGGTLIALAANEIVMDTNAVLGPIDPQLGDFPAASVLKVVERKPVDKIDDMTLVLADQSQKAIAQVTALAQELLSGKMPPEKAKEVAHRLASGIWTHDFPITVETARELIGLPISTEIPGEVFLVTTLYPQAQQSQPSVFYLPGPRYKKGEPAGQEAKIP